MNDLQRAAIEPSLLVGVLDARRDPQHDGQRVREREPAAPLGRAEDPRQRLAVDVLHRVVVPAVLTANVVYGDDVGVLEGRGQATLIEEHPDELGVVAQRLPNALEDDQPLDAPCCVRAR